MNSRPASPMRSRGARRGAPWRKAAVPAATLLFLLLLFLGCRYYWLSGDLHLRSERLTQWAAATEWWQGVQGRMLTHHRPGYQIAYIDPATGELSGVWDGRVNPDRVQEALGKLPVGQWAIVTSLQPGEGQSNAHLSQILQAAGWTGAIAPDGTAAVVVERLADSSRLSVVGAKDAQGPDLMFTLPKGLSGRGGLSLREDFSIHVAQ